MGVARAGIEPRSGVVHQPPVRKALVLAAGMGTRIETRRGTPKPLLPVAGVPMLHRALTNLADVGVKEAIVVVGHLKEAITESLGDRFAGISVRYVTSERYQSTNNAYSLYLALEHLDEDLYLVEGDVVYERELLTRLAEAPSTAACAVARWRPGMDGTVVTVDDTSRVTRIVVGPETAPDDATTYKTINVHLFRQPFLGRKFAPLLERLIEGGGEVDYYEVALKTLVDEGDRDLVAVDCTDTLWHEVDDVNDRLAADYVFHAPEDRLESLQTQHGGLWRYGIRDHALLYNVHFPPPALFEELRRDLPDLLINYPVGQRALNELLSGIVGRPADEVVVANGASELISLLGRCFEKVVLVVPNFNEYAAALGPQKALPFQLPPPAFELDVEALLARVDEVAADAIVVTSPNNPTSVAVPVDDLARLCHALERRGVRLVLDNSFVDFCRKPSDYDLEPQIDKHPNLVVIKSLSKVFGVGGVRLGYLLTRDRAVYTEMRDSIPIWNVNGVAEAFLRVLPRYMKMFRASCSLVRADCDELYDLLCTVDGVRTHRPDANFVLVELPEGLAASAVVRDLFVNHDILTKSCENKEIPGADRYLRIASRTSDENRALVVALADVLGQSASA